MFGSDSAIEDSSIPGVQNLLVFVNSPANVTANWKTQYYLDVQSAEGTTEGSGWYDIGRLVPISAKIPSTPVGMWSINSFDKWEGDYDGTNPNGRIVMNGPKTVIAEWKEDQTPGIVNSMILGGIGVAAFLIYNKTRPGKLRLKKDKKPIAVNEQDVSFDKFFNTRTLRSDTSQQPPFMTSKQKFTTKMINWLFGR